MTGRIWRYSRSDSKLNVIIKTHLPAKPCFCRDYEEMLSGVWIHFAKYAIKTVPGKRTGAVNLIA
jgi:hypothetical protein